ncbi:MAG: Arginine--tRNA ligase [Actinobacteria bacterium]|nr:Arginine--tRNA ligase [Actinomycetota bacterium]
MIRHELQKLLKEAARAMLQDGEKFQEKEKEIVLEKPNLREHGDWASNVALVLAGVCRQNPLVIAQEIVRHLPEDLGYVKEVRIARPGFINFYLSDDYILSQLGEIARDPQGYGKCDLGQGVKLQIEFVSANPVGPLHIGHGRWAALGDSLARIFQSCGYQVEKEFYINDYGLQVRLFGQSVLARYQELFGLPATFPPNGYKGEYVKEYAQELIGQVGDKFVTQQGEEEELISRAISIALQDIRETLELMGVDFQVWFSERVLHEGGEVDKVIEKLKATGKTYEREGALWLRTTDYGDDKDRVLVKADGEKTYFLTDVAYHENKVERGFQKIINIWGADHHGHVRRMEAALEILGYDPDLLEVIIGQLVNLTRRGKPYKMSKRSGEMVTLRDLIEEVGPDAVRYFFLMRPCDSMLDFDIDLARSHSSNNPVYYIQYAHARIQSIMRLASSRGIEVEEAWSYPYDRFSHPGERELAKVLISFPYVVIDALEHRAPHFLTQYGEELASAFHGFYTQCRVISKDKDMTMRRLVLGLMAREIVRKVLFLLGISAPESM